MTNGTLMARADARAAEAMAGGAPLSGDGGPRIEGYASLFGVVDLARDMVEPGAFARSLAKRGAAGIRMLFQHDPAEPVGAWTSIREDANGLYVEGRLTPGVQRSRELAILIGAGALDGLSIGFRTARAATEPRSRVRRILEADLWEISIVTFPMLPGARIRAPQPASGEPARGAAALAARLRAATRMTQRKEP